MYYLKTVNVDNSGKLSICPVCQNEEFDSAGHYCKICGTGRLNFCTSHGCGRQNEPNARFCEFCGEKTEFFKIGLLKPWDQVSEDEKADELPDPFATADNSFTAVATDELPF